MKSINQRLYLYKSKPHKERERRNSYQKNQKESDSERWFDLHIFRNTKLSLLPSFCAHVLKIDYL